MKRLVTCLLIIGLSACVHAPPPRSAGDKAGSASIPEPAKEAARGAVSAGETLVAQGRAQLAAGDTARAAASIERALRIEPRESLWWVELGTVRLAEGDRQQAISLGQKALRLAVNDPAAQAAARRLIEQAGRP